MSEFNSDPNGKKDGKQSLFEHVTKVLLPALSLIAYILTQRTTQNPSQSKLLLALTFVFVAISYYPSLRTRIVRWREQRKDFRVAKNAFPEFREFVRRFAEFVDSRTNDTLHYIVLNELLQGRSDRPPAFNLPSMGLWGGYWQYFAERIDRQRLTMSEFRAALMEFHFLVSTYNNQCVAPIFETLPQNAVAEIPAWVKSKLNSFQQRFGRFLGEYQDFTKPLSDSRPTLQGLPCYFSIPKPLS